LLLNLADNAVKYNQPGGSITMALRQVTAPGLPVPAKDPTASGDAAARISLSAGTPPGSDSSEEQERAKRGNVRAEKHARGPSPLSPSQPARAAEITVTNTGPGISPEALPRVFDRFFRGDPAHSAEVEGCGLGLSIAQWIISVHNGTIRVESVPAKLTTVTVRLPLVPEAPV
jgi:signal transduction histidine kinase